MRWVDLIADNPIYVRVRVLPVLAICPPKGSSQDNVEVRRKAARCCVGPAKKPTRPCDRRDPRQHRIDALFHGRMRSNMAYRVISRAETRRRRCLTIRRNAMKLKRGSRRHRKRLKKPRRPGRTMSPRLGLFEKRLQD